MRELSMQSMNLQLIFPELLRFSNIIGLKNLVHYHTIIFAQMTHESRKKQNIQTFYTAHLSIYTNPTPHTCTLTHPHKNTRTSMTRVIHLILNIFQLILN